MARTTNSIALRERQEKLAILEQDLSYWGNVFMGLKLSMPQQEFVKEYIANGQNGTKAALKSWNCSTIACAATMASSAIRLPDIQRAILRASDTLSITPEWIVKEYKSIVKDKEVTHSDKRATLDSLAKINGLFVDKKASVNMNITKVVWEEERESEEREKC